MRIKNESPVLNAISILSAVLTIISLSSDAIAFDAVSCVTDKTVYIQGDNVKIRISNNTIKAINIVDRNVIDGGFAVIETKQKDSTWKPIELVAVANIIAFNTLEKGASHEYIWNTKGYNKSDTLATPGVYRVILGKGIVSNQFTINGAGNTNP